MADRKQDDQHAQEVNPSDVSSHDWFNHYSPKYDKCFIRDRQIHFEDKYPPIVITTFTFPGFVAVGTIVFTWNTPEFNPGAAPA